MSSSSMSYADYEREYNSHLSRVRYHLARSATATTTSSDVAQCEGSLREARKCANAMLGLAEVDGDPFKVMDSRNRIDRDVVPLEAEVTRRRRGGGDGGGRGGGGGGVGGGRGGRSGLFGDAAVGRLPPSSSSYAPPSIGMDDDDVESSGGSMTMMDGGIRMEESERLLREAQSLCAESEQIGNTTLENMGRQREQIERAGGLIERSIENTRMASQIMKEMARRALKNKIFLYCVIGVLLFANGAMIVHLWRRK
ncbi:hypothetical protein ACHAXA_006265 [Cyclostephanos tholiformis]|uniref:t-SNARE coiled-coil homology domain-containing protein n=1 Tax=Cyclostephanos tholiformis TaxID=382380 RepID=A0ABD3SPP2_9STRA